MRKEIYFIMEYHTCYDDFNIIITPSPEAVSPDT